MTLPFLNLSILRWEYRELYEKDEEGDLVEGLSGPLVLDAWVILHLLSSTGNPVMMEIEREPFEKYVLPQHIDAVIAFWRAVRSGDPYFFQKEEVLEDLLKQKKKRDRLLTA